MKYIPVKFYTLALCVLLAACNTAPVTTTTASSTTTFGPEDVNVPGKPSVPETGLPVDAYLVQPGDSLIVDVWKEKDLQRKVTVRPDGGLDFPLIGNIDVTGKTIDQLRQEIATKLAKYIPDPVVTISVEQSLGNVIYVVGKVNRPGNFVANRNMDVMQALTMAGGLSPYASPNKIKILRREHGVQKTMLFKYSRVEKGEDLEQNIILQGGDVVVVP